VRHHEYAKYGIPQFTDLAALRHALREDDSEGDGFSGATAAKLREAHARLLPSPVRWNNRRAHEFLDLLDRNRAFGVRKLGEVLGQPPEQIRTYLKVADPGSDACYVPEAREVDLLLDALKAIAVLHRRGRHAMPDSDEYVRLYALLMALEARGCDDARVLAAACQQRSPSLALVIRQPFVIQARDFTARTRRPTREHELELLAAEWDMAGRKATPRFYQLLVRAGGKYPKGTIASALKIHRTRVDELLAEVARRRRREQDATGQGRPRARR